MKDKIKFVCEKCGKEMPVDKEKSNDNWTVYTMKCTCGGEAKIEFEELNK